MVACSRVVAGGFLALLTPIHVVTFGTRGVKPEQGAAIVRHNECCLWLDLSHADARTFSSNAG